MAPSSRPLAPLILTDATHAPCLRLVLERDQALRESEARFGAAFDTSPDAFTISSIEDGTYLAVNAAFTQTTGWAPEEVEGRTMVEMGLWDDLADRERLVAELKEHGAVSNLEARFRRKDGSVVVGLVSARVATLGGRACIVSAVRDVTALKEAEAERERLKASLQQAAKMEAIGRLAGGIAHDFNNLLTVILSGVEACRSGDLSQADAAEVVEEVATAAERARDLTRQLLAFGRRQAIARRAVDVAGVLRASEKLLQRILGEQVDLVTAVAAPLWPIRCDPSQLEQVVLNLAVNARDAMPGGGKLRIDAANVEVGPGRAAPHPSIPPGEYVRLSVHDTGCGMSPEVQARAFDPFFTTKPVGHGTGLGLSIVYGAVKQNDGHLVVASDPGKGTVFDVFFPRCGDVPGGEASARTARVHGGDETVLVVEDDPHVRAVTARALRGAGYRVLVAPSGPEAIAMVQRDRPSLDLLVTDAVMPRMSGPAVASALRATCGALRVLFVSGYADPAIPASAAADAPSGLLPKPFTASSLLARVRSLLDA